VLIIFEFGTIVVCCIRDYSSFSVAIFVESAVRTSVFAISIMISWLEAKKLYGDPM
jgi:hypothetical protein